MHDGNNLFCKQTILHNEHVQVEARSLGNFNSNIEVDAIKYRCNIYCDTPYRRARSITDDIESVDNTNGSIELKISS